MSIQEEKALIESLETSALVRARIDHLVAERLKSTLAVGGVVVGVIAGLIFLFTGLKYDDTVKQFHAQTQQVQAITKESQEVVGQLRLQQEELGGQQNVFEKLKDGQGKLLEQERGILKDSQSALRYQISFISDQRKGLAAELETLRKDVDNAQNRVTSFDELVTNAKSRKKELDDMVAEFKKNGVVQPVPTHVASLGSFELISNGKKFKTNLAGREVQFRLGASDEGDLIIQFKQGRHDWQGIDGKIEKGAVLRFDEDVDIQILVVKGVGTDTGVIGVFVTRQPYASAGSPEIQVASQEQGPREP